MTAMAPKGGSRTRDQTRYQDAAKRFGTHGDG
jgi:hypothetical protein